MSFELPGPLTGARHHGKSLRRSNVHDERVSLLTQLRGSSGLMRTWRALEPSEGPVAGADPQPPPRHRPDRSDRRQRAHNSRLTTQCWIGIRCRGRPAVAVSRPGRSLPATPCRSPLAIPSAEQNAAVQRLLDHYSVLTAAAVNYLRPVPNQPRSDQFTSRNHLLAWPDTERAVLAATVALAYRTARWRTTIALVADLGVYLAWRRLFPGRTRSPRRAQCRCWSAGVALSSRRRWNRQGRCGRSRTRAPRPACR